jgi:hypothetical protein
VIQIVPMEIAWQLNILRSTIEIHRFFAFLISNFPRPNSLGLNPKFNSYHNLTLILFILVNATLSLIPT